LGKSPTRYDWYGNEWGVFNQSLYYHKRQYRLDAST
jgi:hypothetical protein